MCFVKVLNISLTLFFSKSYLAQKNVIEKLQDNVSQGKHQTMLESACYLLSYIGDILSALKQTSDRASGATSPPFDGDLGGLEPDTDWMEEMAPEEEDSAAEEDSVSYQNSAVTRLIGSVCICDALIYKNLLYQSILLLQERRL